MRIKTNSEPFTKILCVCFYFFELTFYFGYLTEKSTELSRFNTRRLLGLTATTENKLN